MHPQACILCHKMWLQKCQIRQSRIFKDISLTLTLMMLECGYKLTSSILPKCLIFLLFSSLKMDRTFNHLHTFLFIEVSYWMFRLWKYFFGKNPVYWITKKTKTKQNKKRQKDKINKNHTINPHFTSCTQLLLWPKIKIYLYYIQYLKPIMG